MDTAAVWVLGSTDEARVSFPRRETFSAALENNTRSGHQRKRVKRKNNNNINGGGSSNTNNNHRVGVAIIARFTVKKQTLAPHYTRTHTATHTMHTYTHTHRLTIIKSCVRRWGRKMPFFQKKKNRQVLRDRDSRRTHALA